MEERKASRIFEIVRKISESISTLSGYAQEGEAEDLERFLSDRSDREIALVPVFKQRTEVVALGIWEIPGKILQKHFPGPLIRIPTREDRHHGVAFVFLDMSEKLSEEIYALEFRTFAASVITLSRLPASRFIFPIDDNILLNLMAPDKY